MKDVAIQNLHAQLLTSWNKQDANGMAALFCSNGITIGFDGSEMSGQVSIKTELEKIFSDHKTALYLWKVEEVRFLSSTVALLRAKAGMILPGKREADPTKNVIQSLLTVMEDDVWKISLFQNTPAQYHGRPEMVEKLTSELNKLIKQ